MSLQNKVNAPDLRTNPSQERGHNYLGPTNEPITRSMARKVQGRLGSQDI